MTAVPKPDQDVNYRDDLLGYMQRRMDQHPRSKQKLIGPSEIGGCPRGIAWKLSKGAANGKRSGFASGKGVIMHKWADEEVYGPHTERFMSDLKLPQVVPWVDGGTLDLYDIPKKTIVDFKFPGDPSIVKARRGKPPWGYYVQINAYGIGATKLGLDVERVALLYAPMCGDELWSTTKGAVLLSWPFDPQVAVDQYKAIKRTQDMLAVAPLGTVMSVLPTSEDFCHSRPCWRPNGHPEAICKGHRAGGSETVDPSNPFV